MLSWSQCHFFSIFKLPPLVHDSIYVFFPAQGNTGVGERVEGREGHAEDRILGPSRLILGGGGSAWTQPEGLWVCGIWPGSEASLGVVCFGERPHCRHLLNPQPPNLSWPGQRTVLVNVTSWVGSSPATAPGQGGKAPY